MLKIKSIHKFTTDVKAENKKKTVQCVFPQLLLPCAVVF